MRIKSPHYDQKLSKKFPYCSACFRCNCFFPLTSARRDRSPEIWHNNGNNTFSKMQANLGPHALGPVAWADLNNDGFLDLILTGKTNMPGNAYSTELWQNLGGNEFREDSETTRSHLPPPDPRTSAY
ncbi:MAG: VCBS repeat-containing protein [Verrucomicrobiota bacterium]